MNINGKRVALVIILLTLLAANMYQNQKTYEYIQRMEQEGKAIL